MFKQIKRSFYVKIFIHDTNSKLKKLELIKFKKLYYGVQLENCRNRSKLLLRSVET